MSQTVRGRHIEKDMWKPGERCQAGGGYRCENCRGGGRDTEVQVEAGEIFPLCSHCADLDMGWRRRVGRG